MITDVINGRGDSGQPCPHVAGGQWSALSTCGWGTVVIPVQEWLEESGQLCPWQCQAGDSQRLVKHSFTVQSHANANGDGFTDSLQNKHEHTHILMTVS